jgi:hypothetical protein
LRVFVNPYLNLGSPEADELSSAKMDRCAPFPNPPTNAGYGYVQQSRGLIDAQDFATVIRFVFHRF